MFTIRFDMRAPSFGAPTTALYPAAAEMCAWAETRGCIAVVLCEHHGSEDGYLPSPIVLASAIAARTDRLLLSLTVVLPFYNPVRLAEDLALLDIISNGRASVIFGIGYRPEEYEHFGLNIHRRGRIADEKLDLLRKLLSGEQVVHEGRRIRVTPRSQTPGGPTLMWGGSTLAAARRAGRYGLGLLANGSEPGMQETYETACREHGHEPGAALIPQSDTPSVTFVADDVDQAWDEIGDHLLDDARAYAEWNPANETSAGMSYATNVTELRATSMSHRILSVAEAVERVAGGEMLNLSPLCGGLPPEVAWPYLKRVGEVVLPEAARFNGASASVEGLGDALNELISTKKADQ
ncbi:MAG TPA: LLM class flavin-dependent oxidoreductase [Mycobacterium sp.]|nr:LLM class flavin-dependent oxidoreductase [Mycobacterium sp.]